MSAAAGRAAAAAAPLAGLVLAGGRSTRMQRDKAALDYGGVSQLERAMELLAAQVTPAYVSVRPDQRDEPLRARYAQVEDRADGLGPVAGILAAQALHPGRAWLVLACDLPRLDAATLAHLVAARAPSRMATAYRSSYDGLPEPLCAIWEPASREPLAAYVAAGGRCPRRFLGTVDTLLLDPSRPDALDNVNTPEEYGAVAGAAGPRAGAPARRITVEYYALLREQAGRRAETLTTTAATAEELYAELARRHAFTLPAQVLRVAVNAAFREWPAPLAAGDTVVFIPPVAGG